MVIYTCVVIFKCLHFFPEQQIFVFEIKCFHELGHDVHKAHEPLLFRTICWYFFFTINYFFFGEGLPECVEVLKILMSWSTTAVSIFLLVLNLRLFHST